MKEEVSYDSFCTEVKCFTDKTSFFRFDSDNVHVLDDHEVRAISQATFIRFVKGEQGKNIENQHLFSGICSAIDQIIE